MIAVLALQARGISFVIEFAMIQPCTCSSTCINHSIFAQYIGVHFFLQIISQKLMDFSNPDLMKQKQSTMEVARKG